jgi:hypothetical protein
VVVHPSPVPREDPEAYGSSAWHSCCVASSSMELQQRSTDSAVRFGGRGTAGAYVPAGSRCRRRGDPSGFERHQSRGGVYSSGCIRVDESVFQGWMHCNAGAFCWLASWPFRRSGEPLLVAGCNMPAPLSQEQTVEVVGNHEGGTGPVGWRRLAEGSFRSREWTVQGLWRRGEPRSIQRTGRSSDVACHSAGEVLGLSSRGGG